jgi:hypothetical protein
MGEEEPPSGRDTSVPVETLAVSAWETRGNQDAPTIGQRVSLGRTRMLYDMTDGTLTRVAGTTFKDEKVLERTHLQAAVRESIAVLGPDLLVVAEEFGDFEDTHRRIDLLCIDKTARLVVVELKRTEDGGHMELQALRYAAMVSVMTFEN